MQDDAILGFEHNEYHFLSNFSYNQGDSPYHKTWKTQEHYYQAAKTWDRDWFEKIKAALSPAQAKKLGRSCPARPDWEQIKVEVMLDGLRLKFAPNTRLAEKLLSTGNSYLEETNWWGDRFWGVCRGEGLNWLGKCLMEIRNDLVTIDPKIS